MRKRDKAQSEGAAYAPGKYRIVETEYFGRRPTYHVEREEYKGWCWEPVCVGGTPLSYDHIGAARAAIAKLRRNEVKATRVVE